MTSLVAVLIGMWYGGVSRAITRVSPSEVFKVGTEKVSVMDTGFVPQSGRVNNIYILDTEVGKLKMLEVYTRDNQKLAIPPAPGQEIEIGDIVDFHNIMVLGRVTSQLAFKTTNVALPMSQ